MGTEPRNFRYIAGLSITIVQVILVVGALLGEFRARFTDIGTFSMGIGFSIIGLLYVELVVYFLWSLTKPTTRMKVAFYTSVIFLILGLTVVVNI